MGYLYGAITLAAMGACAASFFVGKKVGRIGMYTQKQMDAAMQPVDSEKELEDGTA